MSTKNVVNFTVLYRNVTVITILGTNHPTNKSMSVNLTSTPLRNNIYVINIY